MQHSAAQQERELERQTETVPTYLFPYNIMHFLVGRPTREGEVHRKPEALPVTCIHPCVVLTLPLVDAGETRQREKSGSQHYRQEGEHFYHITYLIYNLFDL